MKFLIEGSLKCFHGSVTSTLDTLDEQSCLRPTGYGTTHNRLSLLLRFTALRRLTCIVLSEATAKLTFTSFLGTVVLRTIISGD